MQKNPSLGLQKSWHWLFNSLQIKPDQRKGHQVCRTEMTLCHDSFMLHGKWSATPVSVWGGRSKLCWCELLRLAHIRAERHTSSSSLQPHPWRRGRAALGRITAVTAVMQQQPLCSSWSALQQKIWGSVSRIRRAACSSSSGINHTVPPDPAPTPWSCAPARTQKRTKAFHSFYPHKYAESEGEQRITVPPFNSAASKSFKTQLSAQPASWQRGSPHRGIVGK